MNQEQKQEQLTEFCVLFSARVGLIKNTDFHTYPLSYFKNHLRLPREELIRMDAKIRELDLPADLLQYSFPNIAESKTYYNNGRVFLSARVLLDPASVNRLEDLMEFYISGFTDTAADGYLAGDAVVYQELETDDKDGDIHYELVLDDIRAFVYDAGMVKRVYSKKMGNFWFQ
jgi:hypothetical protein